ncbi:Fibroblast growth factor receptor [Balamuthia mandrillaris]
MARLFLPPLVVLTFVLLLTLPFSLSQSQVILYQEAFLKPAVTDLPPALRMGQTGLALDGDLLVVGGEGDHSDFVGIFQSDGYPTTAAQTSPDSGIAFIFRRNPFGEWRQEAVLKGLVSGMNAWFGKAVAVKGETVVVGGPAHQTAIEGIHYDSAWSNTTTEDAYGAVYIYSTRQVGEKKEWVERAYLGPPLAQKGAQFGCALALTEEGRLVVGMLGEVTSLQGSLSAEEYRHYFEGIHEGPWSGAVVVYQRYSRDGEEEWEMEAVIKGHWVSEGNYFGNSVAADGDTILVGAPFENSVALPTGVYNGVPDDIVHYDPAVQESCGAAYVFVKRPSDGRWIQEAFLKPTICYGYSHFGYSVSLSGDVAVVGSYPPGQETEDEAWIYRRDPQSGSWRLEQRVRASYSDQETADGHEDDAFGSFVSVFGDVTVVGAPYEPSVRRGVALGEEGVPRTEKTAGIGAAFLFRQDEQTAESWKQLAYIKPSNPSQHVTSFFGSTIAYDKGIIAVGSPYESTSFGGVLNGEGPEWAGGSTEVGAVFVFASNLHPCSGSVSSSSSSSADCIAARWMFGSDVVVEGSTMEGEQRRKRESEGLVIEGTKKPVVVKGSLMVASGAGVRLVVEDLSREEPFFYLAGCAELEGDIVLELHTNITETTTIPLIYEDTSDCDPSQSNNVTLRVSTPFNNDMTAESCISATSSKTGQTLSVVLTPSNDYQLCVKNSRTSEDDSDPDGVVVPVVVSVVAFLLLLFVLAGVIIFLVMGSKRKKRAAEKLRASPSSTTVEGYQLHEARKDTQLKEDGEVDLEDGTTKGEKTVPEIPKAEVKYKKQPVASGAFGIVYKGTWRGRECAIKVSSNIILDKDLKDEFRREALIMHTLGGKENHCVTLYGVMTTGKRLCLVTEWAEYGSAFDLLINEKTRNENVAWESIVKIARDSARGLRYLHSLNVVHRDIAARNILVCKNYRAVLGDFGMSRVLEKMYQTTKSDFGAVKWMAPEAIEVRKYSKETDCYSFGVFLWELCARQEPWHGLDVLAVARKVLDHGERLQIRENEDSVMKDLMIRCWDADPSQRPDMDEICAILEEHYRSLKEEATHDHRTNEVAGYLLPPLALSQ